MKSKHADVTFGIDLQGIPDIPAAIVRGDAHLGIAFQVPRRPELRQVSLDRFQVGAIMRPDHPLAKRKQLNIAACAACKGWFAGNAAAVLRSVRTAAPNRSANSIRASQLV